MAGTSSGSCCYYSSRCSLPSAWEPRVAGMRNQNAMQYLKVDGSHVTYVGPGTDDLQAATIRANYPLPADCPLYYFEVKVLDRGQDCFIGIGFCTEEVQLGRLPGWDSHSYGYHGDDGHAFAGSGIGRPYGPTFTTGDVIGALYNKADRTISYYKNGEPLGPAFREVQEALPLFPCVGLRTRGESVVANFGSGTSVEPFRTDFTAIRSEFQRRVMDSVRKSQLPLLCSRGTALLPQLMYDYLLHQRCWRTAAVLGRDLLRGGGGGSGGSSGGGGGGCQLDEQALADITVRQQTYDLVVAGRIDEALELLRATYPAELLADRPSLDFRLRLQKFVEMVAAANAASAASSSAVAATPVKQPPPPPQPGKGSDSGAAPASSGCGGEGSAEAGTSGSQGGKDNGSAAAGEAAEAAGPGLMDASDGREGTRGSPGGEDAGTSCAGPKGAAGGREAAAVGDGAGACGSAAKVPTTRDILAYGTQELRPRCRTSTDRDLLTDALSLLAFDDPAASPAGYMLRPAHRISLAEELNGAMLACRGLPATSPLERVYQQLTVVMGELKRGDHAHALALPDPRTMLVEPAHASAAGPGGSGREGGDPMTI